MAVKDFKYAGVDYTSQSAQTNQTNPNNTNPGNQQVNIPEEQNDVNTQIDAWEGEEGGDITQGGGDPYGDYLAKNMVANNESWNTAENMKAMSDYGVKQFGRSGPLGNMWSSLLGESRGQYYQRQFDKMNRAKNRNQPIVDNTNTIVDNTNTNVDNTNVDNTNTNVNNTNTELPNYNNQTQTISDDIDTSKIGPVTTSADNTNVNIPNIVNKSGKKGQFPYAPDTSDDTNYVTAPEDNRSIWQKAWDKSRLGGGQGYIFPGKPEVTDTSGVMDRLRKKNLEATLGNKVGDGTSGNVNVDADNNFVGSAEQWANQELMNQGGSIFGRDDMLSKQLNPSGTLPIRRSDNQNYNLETQEVPEIKQGPIQKVISNWKQAVNDRKVNKWQAEQKEQERLNQKSIPVPNEQKNNQIVSTDNQQVTSNQKTLSNIGQALKDSNYSWDSVPDSLIDAIQLTETGGASADSLAASFESEGAVGPLQQRKIFQDEIARLDPSMAGYDPNDLEQAKKAAKIYIAHQMKTGLTEEEAIMAYNAGRTGAKKGIGKDYLAKVQKNRKVSSPIFQAYDNLQTSDWAPSATKY